jgi:hypothetical protein
MSKFNLEFRMKVVTEYFSGKGATSLAKEYGVSNDSTVLGWVHQFERWGIAGLKKRVTGQEYSSQFKVDVLNWRKQNELHFQLLPYTSTCPRLVPSGSGKDGSKNQG